MKLTSHNLHRQGFTLVELLLVMMIIATLAAIVIPKFAGRSEQAKITAAQAQISAIGLALDSFEVDCGYYPKNGDLTALIQQPSDSTSWKGPYLSKGIPSDPWNNAYVYEYPGKHNANGYDLVSAGPDGRAGTDDDINNWDANKK
ncbi:MAG: type II secretion system major pseudopilin GspG [Verrucomicrobia bacterium]|nr:type II secretion system major pseudopilin GspG [Verrucomicrobiota bacterium]